jgi:hypothetical protein
MLVVALALLFLASCFIPAAANGDRGAAAAFIVLAGVGLVVGAIGWRRESREKP